MNADVAPFGACIVLETFAEDAADALTENLLSESPDNNVCMALGSIGVRGIIPLTYGIQHKNKEIQRAASFALSFHAAHLNTEPTLWFLTNTLNAPEPDLRARAAMALGVIGGEKDDRELENRPVQALATHVTDSNATVRGWVAFALGRFPTAIEAFNALTRMKSDTDADVRESVANALDIWRTENMKRRKQSDVLF
jgi:HEAT repeat protein